MKDNRAGFRIALAALCLAVVARADDGEAGKIRFSAAAYIEHIRFLSSDEMGGRNTGSEEIYRAAEYVVAQFKEAGCEPGGVDGTFFQPFEVSLGRKLNAEVATLRIKGVDHTFTVREDWIPLPFRTPKEADGPLAFAGYGITAPEHEYDDYADFEVEGKLLLMLRHEPKADDPDAEFGGERTSDFATFQSKLRLAADKGAKGVLIVNAPSRYADKDPLYRFRRRGGARYGMPVIHITQDLANAILEKAGMPDLKTLDDKLIGERESLAADLEGVSVRINTGIEREVAKARNVLGLLRGDGSTDEVIVVGAHYDHVGKQKQKDGSYKIFNGADDNASGTAGVIEMAKAFAKGKRPRRNILFMTFSGEEKGLLGSAHFVKEPTVDLDRIKAMINMDMIGRLSNDKFEVNGTWTGEGFKKLVKDVADEIALEYKEPGPGGSIFGRSDHANFFRKGIPVLFPFTGIHGQYHRPEDDWELIDAEGATKVLELVYRVTHQIADMEDGPVYVDQKTARERASAARGDVAAKDDEKQAPQARAAEDAKDKPAADDAAPRMPRVRLGIAPAYSEGDKPGLVIDLIMDGPAKKAGLKVGDRIIKIGDQTIDDIYAYMAVLGKARPGDEVKIVVVREGAEKTFTVKLAASRSSRDDG